MGQSDIVSTLGGTVAPKGGAGTIGMVLIEAGRLTPDGAERILRLQREEGLRFGDAAIRLGLLSVADVQFALSRQFHYPYLVRGHSAVSEELVAAYDPFGARAESLRALRSQLTLRWFDNDPSRKALTIVSAARKEGRSFVAANLAVVFAQLGERTLLIDADLRHPRQHQLFGLENRVGLSAVLAGRGGPETVQHVPSLPKLSVLPAGALPPNPQELLASPIFPELLHQLAEQLDVILLDSPAAADTADAQILAVRSGAALIVARTNATRMWRVQGVTDSVVQARATIVGSVLNDF
ncbi:MAG: chain length determinant protein tyrosine kinase EpsG [Burkholderiales bacterium]